MSDCGRYNKELDFRRFPFYCRLVCDEWRFVSFSFSVSISKRLISIGSFEMNISRNDFIMDLSSGVYEARNSIESFRDHFLVDSMSVSSNRKKCHDMSNTLEAIDL